MFSNKTFVLFAFLLLCPAFCDNVYIYNNGQLQSGWDNWSWSTTVNWNDTSLTYNSQPSAQVAITSGWGALSVEHQSLSTNSFTQLIVSLFGGSDLLISVVNSSGDTLFSYSSPASSRTSNQWNTISVEFSGSSNFNQIWIQDWTGGSQSFNLGTLYLTESSSGGGSSGNNNSTAWWNGLNIPWNDFGYDIGDGDYNSSWFQTFFDTCDSNDVNSARFWVHCDGRGSPNFDSSGNVSGLSSTFLSDLENLIQRAEKSNVVMLITLWSFDMCNQEVSNGLHVDLISDQSKTQSYINNALIPILKSVGNYTNVVWEVINEPEWCIQETPPSTLTSVPLSQMQRFVAMIASAIHQNSNQKVTVGSASLKWNSNVSPAVGNWWQDSSLQSAFNSQSSYLDFYQSKFF